MGDLKINIKSLHLKENFKENGSLMIQVIEKTENQVIATKAIKPTEKIVTWNEELQVQVESDATVYLQLLQDKHCSSQWAVQVQGVVHQKKQIDKKIEIADIGELIVDFSWEQPVFAQKSEIQQQGYDDETIKNELKLAEEQNIKLEVEVQELKNQLEKQKKFSQEGNQFQQSLDLLEKEKKDQSNQVSAIQIELEKEKTRAANEVQQLQVQLAKEQKRIGELQILLEQEKQKSSDAISKLKDYTEQSKDILPKEIVQLNDVQFDDSNKLYDTIEKQKEKQINVSDLNLQLEQLQQDSKNLSSNQIEYSATFGQEKQELFKKSKSEIEPKKIRIIVEQNKEIFKWVTNSSIEEQNSFKQNCFLTDMTLLEKEELFVVAVDKQTSSNTNFQITFWNNSDDAFLTFQNVYYNDKCSILNYLLILYLQLALKLSVKPQFNQIRLESSDNLEQEIVIQILDLPYNPIRTQVQIKQKICLMIVNRTENQNYLLTILIPNTFNKLTTFQSISSDDMVEEWKNASRNKSNQFQTAAFSLNDKFVRSISDLKEKFPLLIEIPSKNEKLKFGGKFYFRYQNGNDKLDETNPCLLKILFVAEKVILKLMVLMNSNENDIVNKACKFYLETLHFLLS